MAMLQLHIPRVFEELGIAADRSRFLQQRLLHLLRTLDYDRSSPSLSTAMSKALCCIFIHTIIVGRDDDDKNVGADAIPPCCIAVGLRAAEYQYLVHKAILAFDVVTPSVVEDHP